jgi:hypothetical protein
MSTSDPYTPNGSAPPPATEPAAAAVPEPEPAPVVDETSPLSTTRAAAVRAAAAHAATRPAPTPPPPSFESSPATVTPAAAPAPEPAPAPAQPAVVTPTDRTDIVPEPVAPRSTGFGGHVWGVVVGALVTPVVLAVILIGQERILTVQVDGWDASLDVPGIVLVTIGALVLAGLVYLGLWTAAVPITGGLLATVVGAVFLFAPGVARDQTMRWLATAKSTDAVSHATVVGTSGTILLVGLLLLVAGVVISWARRQGRVLGAFRERSRTA